MHAVSTRAGTLAGDLAMSAGRPSVDHLPPEVAEHVRELYTADRRASADRVAEKEAKLKSRPPCLETRLFQVPRDGRCFFHCFVLHKVGIPKTDTDAKVDWSAAAPQHSIRAHLIMPVLISG